MIGDHHGYRPADTISRLEAAIIISRETVPDRRIAAAKYARMHVPLVDF